MLGLRLARAQSDWQSATNGTDAAVKRKLADGKNIGQMLGFAEIAVSPENAESNRQVKTRAFFAHVRRRPIDCVFLKWKKEGAVINCGANAFTRFAHSQVRQTNNND